MAEAYIVAAARTAGGRRNGRLAGWHPADLAGKVLESLVDRTKADPALVDQVIMGCVGQAGEQSTNIARNAVLSSKFPESVPAVAVDSQCGSSQQALQFAAQAVMSGTMDIVIAAGVESMTRVPMGTPAILAAKAGLGFSKSPSMEMRYPGVQFSQFAGAEMMAKKYGLSKDELDKFSLRSHQLAAKATREGWFKDEIVPVQIQLADGTPEMHEVDEGIRMDASLEGLQGLKLLQEGGVLTAGSSSQICDGASGVMVVSEKGLKQLGVQPLARIHHMSVLASDPVIMLETPIPVTKLALERLGWKIDDIDLFEINEAFASVPMSWIKELGADPERVNVHGGAIALGHPLGGSGTKLMATLIYALKRQNKRYGLQSMCEGGGMSHATIIERL